MTKGRLLFIFLFIVFGSGLLVIDQYGQTANDTHLMLAIICLVGMIISSGYLLVSFVFHRPARS